MKNILKIGLNVLIDLLILPAIFFLLLNPDLSTYLITQAKGQYEILIQSKKIKQLIANGNFKKKELENLKLIEEIKYYSIAKLNFNPSKSYLTYFNQEGKNLIWNVTACKPYSFIPYEWKYPFLGKLSYKGFFDSIKAVNEINRLRKLGYDADLSGVQAWSTLGYLSDPVFSEMLKKNKGELCELIFHELFHGTIYASGKTELNENLAEFVAKNATIRFLKSDTSSLKSYLKYQAKEDSLNDFMLNAIDRLKTTYSFLRKTDLAGYRALNLKKNKINDIINDLKRTSFISEKSKNKFIKRIKISGNAFLMHYNRYNFFEDSLNKILDERFKGHLELMILDLKKTFH